MLQGLYIGSTMAELVDPLPHNLSSIPTSGAVCEKFAQSPYDHMGFLQGAPYTSQRHAGR